MFISKERDYDIMAVTREEQRNKVLNTVTEVSFKLFMERGYKETKLSDISKASGIHIGSIYNIFQDKEDIVCELVIRDYSLIMAEAEKISDTDDLTSQVAFPMATEFRLARMNPNIARLICVGYSSSKTMNALIDMQFTRMKDYFSKFGRPLDEQWVKRRLCGTNGVIGSLIACPSGDDIRNDLKIGVELFCASFGIPAFDSDKIVSEAIRLVDEHPPERYLIGF